MPLPLGLLATNCRQAEAGDAVGDYGASDPASRGNLKVDVHALSILSRRNTTTGVPELDAVIDP